MKPLDIDNLLGLGDSNSLSDSALNFVKLFINNPENAPDVNRELQWEIRDWIESKNSSKWLWYLIDHVKNNANPKYDFSENDILIAKLYIHIAK